ncbi:hypothetical protein [uncultured Chryseobacterium sp.]|uniref:hypothetical protein n=1 Tax=uncultured Chryseobacterium sp. TaxID=259322 RepID=UPI0025D8E862|nr:hypothetical protein [uncultured Chryseobacterium sp.]
MTKITGNVSLKLYILFVFPEGNLNIALENSMERFALRFLNDKDTGKCNLKISTRCLPFPKRIST